MSTASARSYRPNRSVNSIHHGDRRARAGSRATQLDVSADDVYGYALRVAFLNYLLQPKKKRKEFVSAPKPPPRAHTSVMSDIIQEFVPAGASSSSANLKLPHGFRAALERRISGALMGTEKLPGYNDAAIKRTFGEAWTAFTKAGFQKNMDKDRKIEPYILMFYTCATKAQKAGKPDGDDSWKAIADRHLAMFVRLVVDTLRDLGGDQSRPELMSRFATLEKKLLTNDQDLYIDTGQDGEHKTVEVEIPLSYEVKDMPMVHTVARIFGRTAADAQGDIDSSMSFWTEEAALKDLKAYQHRLTSDMAGALRRQDFDVNSAFEEWKKTEIHHLAQMMLEILTARPELARTSSGFENPLPARPHSTYGEDQAYADLSRMLSNPDSGAIALDGTMGMGSLALDDPPSIRAVDEPTYTFIPPDPRQFYKLVLVHAMAYDQANPGSPGQGSPLSKPSSDLLTELAAHWRLPQVSRHIATLEAAAQQFFDSVLKTEELDLIFDIVQERPIPEAKKPPYIQLYSHPLRDIHRSLWTLQDYKAYQQVLYRLNEAMLRDLYENLARCFEPKAPPIGPPLMFIMNHIKSDEAFSQKPEAAAQFSQALAETLAQKAKQVYRDYLDSTVPQSQEDWDFSHVVNLGKAVVDLCGRISKRYRKNPEIMGVKPFTVLVETLFPNFEQDANAIIQRVITVAKDRGLEVNLQDGFDLYKELVEIRKIHVESLPGQPFAFHIEGVLDEFVWRWIKGAESKMEEFVEEAIKHDPFQVRKQQNPEDGPEDIPEDTERHSSSIIDIFQLFNQTVDQVFQLEWDDDVHHARFMTALSKAIAAGLGRYCEIVEQKFAKEMDRPSAQEVAMATKTTQERFVQYARDALSTKEKVEPFQFYAEVRVTDRSQKGRGALD